MPLSFASWCMLHIHNSASLRGVCADTPISFASLVYLLHIHNSAVPRLCIFAYTILSSDVRHYYTIHNAVSAWNGTNLYKLKILARARNKNYYKKQSSLL